MEAVGRRRKTARERRDQCLRAEARRLRRAQAIGGAMVHRRDKYQSDPFLVLGARLDVLEQQFALSQELTSGAAVSLQAALDSCSSGVTEMKDVVLPGLRDDVGGEVLCALSLFGWMIWPIASMMISARWSATLLRSLMKLSSLLKSWEFSLRDHRGLRAVNLKRRVEQTWQQSFRSGNRTILSMVLKCRTSLAEVDSLSEQFLHFETVTERTSVLDDWLEQRFGASSFSY